MKSNINRLNSKSVLTIASRTFGQMAHSPIAYIVAIFYYGFVGGLFGMNFLLRNHGSIDGVGEASMWILWFVIPGLNYNYYLKNFL
jgi:hypothetical protein